jgi:nucleoside-diphosphate-sugar epimerase
VNIFVTGGSGFIGGALIRKLAPSHKIWALSRTPQSDDLLKQFGALPVRGDLNQFDTSCLAECDAVVHSAAHIGPGGDRNFYWSVNVAGTEKILRTAQAAGVKRLIHVGTEAGCFFGQHMRDIDETYPLALDSPYHYPATKAAAELKVLRANDPKLNFETISIRPRLVWGEGDRTLLPNMVKAARFHALVWIDGGRCLTSTTHVDNVVHAIELTLNGKGRGGEAYFVTDGEDRPFREVITKLLATQGLAPGSLSIPSWLVRPPVYLLQKSWEALGIHAHLPINRFAVALIARDCTIRIDKARRELGYEPIVSFSAGLQQLPRLKAA